MSKRPTSNISWAESAAPADVSEPSVTRPAGWQDEQAPPHNHFNWIQREIGRWIAYQRSTGRAVQEAAEGMQVGEHRVIDIGSYGPGDEIFVTEQPSTVYTPVATDGLALYCRTDSNEIAKVTVDFDDGSLTTVWTSATSVFDSDIVTDGVYVAGVETGTGAIRVLDVSDGSVAMAVTFSGTPKIAMDGESLYILVASGSGTPETWTASRWDYSGAMDGGTADATLAFDDDDLTGSGFTLHSVTAQGGRFVAAATPTTGDDIGLSIDFSGAGSIDEFALSTSATTKIQVVLYEDLAVFVTNLLGIEVVRCPRVTGTFEDQFWTAAELVNSAPKLSVFVDGDHLILVGNDFRTDLRAYSLMAGSEARVISATSAIFTTDSVAVYDGSHFYVTTADDELTVVAGVAQRRHMVRVAPSKTNPTPLLMQPVK